MQDEPDIEITRAGENDIEKVNELMQALLGAPIEERRGYFSKALTSDDYIALIAKKAEEIVGFLDIWSFPDVGHGANMGIIMNFIVAEKYRSLGIGSSLMEEAVKVAEERKLHELHVWTDFKNKDAINVYKKLGFTNECLLLEREFK